MRRILPIALVVMLGLVLAAPAPVSAEQAERVWRVGFLTPGKVSPGRMAAFREGIQALGYVVGKNLVIEERYANGRRSRLSALARHLVAHKIDVFLTHGDATLPADRAAKAAGKAIPVVFAVAADPVGSGFVKSLARPGGHVTGLSDSHSILVPKRLELLKEAVPSIRRVAVFWSPKSPFTRHQLAILKGIAPRLGITLIPIAFGSKADVEPAFAALKAAKADALNVLGYPFTGLHRRRIVRITQAQQAGKVYRIGWLTASTINPTFRKAMGELGYVEGKHFVFEYRQAKRRAQYPALARELVARKVDLILTVGVSATRAAKEATRTIPIVMGNSSANPVSEGLIDSLARPGGNVTGVFDLLPALAGKRVELLKEVFPKLSRIAHIGPGGPVTRAHLKATVAAARRLGVGVQALTVKKPGDLEGAFRAATQGRAEAAIVVGVSFFIPNRPRIVELEDRFRLPTMHTHQRWVPLGGLLAYTTDSRARYRRAAEFVDKIIRGAKPADLPAEQPTNYILQLNMKTAKAIGVTIPRSVLLRAGEVIE